MDTRDSTSVSQTPTPNKKFIAKGNIAIKNSCCSWRC